MIRVIPFNEKYAAKTVYLIMQYKEKFADDYQNLNTLEDIIELVEKHKNNLFIAVDNEEFFGCFWAFDFLSNKNNTMCHSCTFNGAAIKGISPRKTLEALEIYTELLYNLYGVVKIKAYVAVDNSGKYRKKNKNCATRQYINPATKILEKLRFKREGFLKGENLKDNNLIDYIIFGKISSKYLRGRKNG